MPITLRLITLFAALIAATFLAVSCSDKTAEKQEPAQIDTTAELPVPDTVANVRRVTIGDEVMENDPDSLREIDPRTFADWKAIAHENIRMLYPSNHAHASQINQVVMFMSAAVNRTCQFLQMDRPQNQITVIYYTGPGQAKEITGMVRSFVLGDTLHHWPPNNIGLPVMKYLIPKWQPAEPKHKFLRNGLANLLANPGNDYHKRTLQSYTGDRFWHLRQLAVDSALNGYTERRESAMAASFVDFLVYQYGIEKFNELYCSEEEFGAAVQKTFGMSVDELQRLWIGLLQTVVPAMEGQGN